MTSPNTEAAQLLAKRLLDLGTKAMTAREKRVIERVAKRAAVSRDINLEYDQGSKFGGRLADQVASFGGSWTFLIIFGVLILAWVGLNTPCWRRPLTPIPISSSIFPVASRLHPGPCHPDVAEPAGGQGQARGGA